MPEIVKNHIEQRVAKLETGVEILTRDVANLAHENREQGRTIETQIKELAINVTQAAAPRRTDWGTLIALAMLILAMSSAVFWPLNQSVSQLREQVQEGNRKFEQHQSLVEHPVGQALIQQLGGSFSDFKTEYHERVHHQELLDAEELRAWRNKASGLSMQAPANTPVPK